MARPQKEGMDYFPHDVDAANDEKIEALRSLYGNDGYAFYFIMLERIYRTKNFELNISDAETIQILSRKVGVTQELFQKMVLTSVKHGAFELDDYNNRSVLTSNGIKKRANIVISKRVKMKNVYDLKVSDAETPPETLPETPQSKGKIKERESKNKEKNIKDSMPGDKPPDEPKVKKENPDADPLNKYHQAAVHFSEMVLKANPTCKVPKEGTEAMGKWAKEIRLMFESDKRDREHVRETLTYCFEKDAFWSHTCQSPANFRKNYDKISGKMLSSQKTGGNKPNSKFAQSIDTMNEWLIEQEAKTIG